MAAREIGIKRYRQNRLVAFMVSSIEFRELLSRFVVIAFMLAGLAPAVQEAELHA
jgi:hypothetical protein